MAHPDEIVKGRFAKFREWLSDRAHRALEWFECHPRTLAYITFFLALNYTLDFGPKIIDALSGLF